MLQLGFVLESDLLRPSVYRALWTGGGQMKAARVLRIGPPNVITNDDLSRPEPAAGQLLVHVKAAGVGNWDALIREGKVELQPLPLILGSELSGIVEAIGADHRRHRAGKTRTLMPVWVHLENLG